MFYDQNIYRRFEKERKLKKKNINLLDSLFVVDYGCVPCKNRTTVSLWRSSSLREKSSKDVFKYFNSEKKYIKYRQSFWKR